jgi:type IV pilus assembly protein PilM
MGKPGDKPSFWKQEITFRRTPKGPALPETALPVEPEQVTQPEHTSIWKKEISMRRKPKEQPPQPPVAPAEPSKPEPVDDLLYPLAEEPLDPDVAPSLEPQDQGAAYVPTMPTEPEPAAELLRPLVEQPADPVVLSPLVLGHTPARPTEPEPELVAEPEPISEPDPEPVADLQSEPAFEPELPQQLSGRERKEAERVAERLAKEERRRAKEAARAAKTSIWKKEISLGRKRKDSGGPVQAETPVELGPAAVDPLDPAELPPVSPQAASPADQEPPRKLSRGERKEAKHAAEEEQQRAEQLAQVTQTSIWKKEVSFRRKPKEEQPSIPLARSEREEAKRVAVRLAEEERRRAQRAKAEKTSIWKKEITFGRKPKEGALLPPHEPQPEPELEAVSVPDSFDPIVEALSDPIPLPPVTPAVAGLVLPEPTVEPPPVLEVAEPEPQLPPAIQFEPEPPRSRRERRQDKQEAERRKKEERRRAKHLAKHQRKAAPTHKRLVGLKVGGSQIAAVQVVNKGGPRIIRMARAPLERGIVVGGELREADELAAALKTFFRKNKLPRNAVRLGISNNRIGVRTFEISGIEDERQLANAVRFRAQEALPIPLDEAVLDYRILEDRVGEDGVRTRRILLVVAHRELVDRYMTACKKAGLKLVGIDLEAFALLRALGDPARTASADDGGLVCISIGHDRSTLAVSNGSVCEFTRVLAWGGASLDVAVARVLDLTPSEAEPVKRALSLGGEGQVGGLDARRADEARAAMAVELQSFARELVASLRFYQEQPDSLGIAKVLVTGGGAQCGGLAEELERLIGVSVSVADPLARVKVPRKARKMADAAAGSLAIAVGLGIED